MKKILAATLAIILCLGLCACSGVTQEVYDAAKAEYEEISAKYDELKSKVDKYSTVIEALEKEDYDGAVEAVNAMRPAPEITEVEITMDNLWDYFEITEDRHEESDANGDLYSRYITNFLSLKKEYELADREEYPTDVAVGFEYDSKVTVYYSPCTIDFEALTCTKGTVCDRTNSHESKMAHFPQSSLLDQSYANNPTDKNNNNLAIIQRAENFEILNASGTLYLVNK